MQALNRSESRLLPGLLILWSKVRFLLLAEIATDVLFHRSVMIILPAALYDRNTVKRDVQQQIYFFLHPACNAFIAFVSSSKKFVTPAMLLPIKTELNSLLDVSVGLTVAKM